MRRTSHRSHYGTVISNRSSTPPETTRNIPPPWWDKWVLVAIHTAGVVLLLGYLIVAVAMADPSVPDANIGAAMAAFGLAIFGLPWSLPAKDVDPDRLQVLIVTASALLNLAIHATWVWLRQARKAAHR